jgi:hypothetical protein
MWSIYFRDPLGQLFELACYKFTPPVGYTEGQVLHEAHNLRVARGDYNITDEHLADAIEQMIQRATSSLSEDRSVKNPYGS